MSASSVMGRLKPIFTNVGIPAELLCKDILLYQELKLDSVEIVEISLGIKHEFAVNVKLETKPDMTLSHLCDYIEAAMCEKCSIEKSGKVSSHV